MSLVKRLFVDRDGTLIEEPEDLQVDRLEKVRLVAGVIPALCRLRDAGYRFIMVTNQDGLGTPSFPQEDFEGPHRMALDLFASQGIEFDDVLICPHLPDAGCLCRKPHLGLVRPYLDERLDRERSCVVGDRETDLALAENMGLRGFRVGPSGGDTWPSIASALIDQPRTGQFERQTRETHIVVAVDLDGSRDRSISTGLGFFDHMLEQLAAHGGFGLRIEAQGDLQVDPHHTVEDTALALGAALRRAVGDKRGIGRYGFVLPMDEAQARVALDLSGRPLLRFEAPAFLSGAGTVGGLPVTLVRHFFRSLSDAMGMTLHIEADGEDAHHVVEGIFKGVARSLGAALSRSDGALPSTKGSL